MSEINPAIPPRPSEQAAAAPAIDMRGLLEENNRLLQEQLRVLKRFQRLQTVKFVLMVLFIVLPLLATILVLPAFLRELAQGMSGLQEFTSDGGVLDVLNQFQQ